MQTDELSPYIRVAWDNWVKSPWYVRERVIFDYELLYIKAGEVDITVDGRSYRGIPGDIFMFRPKQPHSIAIAGDGSLRQPHIHFDLFTLSDSRDVKVSFIPPERISADDMKYFRQDILDSFICPFPSHIRLHNTSTFEKLLFDVINEHNSKSPYRHLMTKGLFIQLFSYLLREIYVMQNKQIAGSMEIIADVKNYLDTNVCENITLDDLAEYAHLSKYYISHVFKELFGVSPLSYHLTLKINKAKELIRFSNMSIGNISAKLGFDSISSFTRAFKKKEDVPPSFYRK